MNWGGFVLWGTALSAALSPAVAQAELTCDLNAGTMGSLQVGRPADAKAISSAIGMEPASVDENFPSARGYLFPEKGIEITTLDDDGGEVVSQIAVFYAAGQDFYGVAVGRYRGGFVPALHGSETIDSIKRKLGVPAREYLPAPGVSEPGKLIFRRPFGTLDFLFGSDGGLRHITLDKPDFRDEGRASANDAWIRKVVFSDGAAPSAQAPLASRPWTAGEKQAVLTVLAEVRSREAGLTDRAVGYRPLSFHRTGRIGAEGADALTDQRMNAIFLGDSFFGFNTAGMTRILTHELAHLADAFGRHSGDPDWLRLTEESRSRVAGRLAAQGLSVHKAALAAKSEYEEAAKKEGFFSLWSCLSPSEALADAAADHSLGRSPTLPGADDYVRRMLLSAFSRDPWEESMHSGSAAMASGKWDAAIEAFAAAAGRKPALGIAYLFRAEAQEKKGDLGGASADLGRAVDGHAGSEAYFRRAKLRLKNNEPDKAVSDLTEYIRLVPWMERGYELRASAFRAQGALDLAIGDYSSLLDLSPGNTQARARRGDLHYARKDYDKAIADFSLVIEKDAANAATAYTRRAKCWLGKSDPERAVSDLEAALKLEPRNWNALGLLMEASFARSDHARVIAEAQGILRLNPKNPYAHQMRGRSLLATGMRDEAEAEFSRLVELDPKSALAHWGLGEVYAGKELWERAVSAYSKAIGLDPRYLDAYVSRAKAYERFATPFNSGQYRAVEDYSQAISLSTGNARLYFEKGRASAKAGMPKTAQDAFYNAAALSPETVEFHIAKAESELGLWLHDKNSNWIDSAAATIGAALRLAPDDQEVRSLAERIESARQGAAPAP